VIVSAIAGVSLPPHIAHIVTLTDEVMAAAESVCNSYRARGGYTVPLSVNLRRLDNAVRVWQEYVSALQLDSDTNGHDRSARSGQKEL
jgi:hypothetical protein